MVVEDTIAPTVTVKIGGTSVIHNGEKVITENDATLNVEITVTETGSGVSGYQTATATSPTDRWETTPPISHRFTHGDTLYIWVKDNVGNVSVENKVTVKTKVATPVISPASGDFDGTQSVTLSCGTTGATIYYTTNGSEPKTSSTLYTADTPFTIGETTTIGDTATVKAIAVKEGYGVV